MYYAQKYVKIPKNQKNILTSTENSGKISRSNYHYIINNKNQDKGHGTLL